MSTVEQRLTRLEAVYEHLATKANIADLRAEMKADFGRLESQTADLRAEMKADSGNLRAEMKADSGNLRAEMKADNGNLRAEMHRINATLIRWLVSLMAGSLVIGLGAITAIFRFLG